MESPAFARIERGTSERLRAAGRSDLRSEFEQRLGELEESGRLEVQVELGKAQVPDAGRFRELLERAARIARINATANPPA